MKRTLRQIKATAHHEAGHAVVADSFGDRFTSVTIIPNGNAVGAMRPDPSGRHVRLLNKLERDENVTFDAIRKSCITLLAGVAAEKCVTGRHNWRGAHSDAALVTDLLLKSCASADQATLLYRYFWRCTQDIVARLTDRIEALATALVERKTLSYDEARAVFRRDYSAVFAAAVASAAASLDRPEKKPARRTAPKKARRS